MGQRTRAIPDAPRRDAARHAGGPESAASPAGRTRGADAAPKPRARTPGAAAARGESAAHSSPGRVPAGRRPGPGTNPEPPRGRAGAGPCPVPRIAAIDRSGADPGATADGRLRAPLGPVPGLRDGRGIAAGCGKAAAAGRHGGARRHGGLGPAARCRTMVAHPSRGRAADRDGPPPIHRAIPCAGGVGEPPGTGTAPAAPRTAGRVRRVGERRLRPGRAARLQAVRRGRLASDTLGTGPIARDPGARGAPVRGGLVAARAGSAGGRGTWPAQGSATPPAAHPARAARATGSSDPARHPHPARALRIRPGRRASGPGAGPGPRPTALPRTAR
jgi:hypothetical protein